MYYINYHTGAGNETAKTLEEAMEKADEGAAYTQENMTIYNLEDGSVVAERYWSGTAYDPDEVEEENPITFGSFGHYSDWVLF